MNTKIERNYLEIHSLKDLVESKDSFNELEIKLIDPMYASSVFSEQAEKFK